MAEPVSVQHLGRLMLRSWVLILICSILGGAAAVAASFLITPVYTASATQLVKGLPGKEVGANYQAAQFAVNRAKSYPSFVYSSTVLEGVRSDLNNTESIADLREDLSATNPIDTPLVVISATAPSATEARDKANAAARHMARFITQIETVAGVSPITVETPVEASTPKSTTSPKRLLMGAVGALLGFGIGTLVAVARGSRRPSGRTSTGDPGELTWWTDAPHGHEPEQTPDQNVAAVRTPVQSG